MVAPLAGAVHVKLLCIVTSMCSMVTEIVRQKGLEHITVDDLVAEITPKGRGE